MIGSTIIEGLRLLHFGRAQFMTGCVLAVRRAQSKRFNRADRSGGNGGSALLRAAILHSVATYFDMGGRLFCRHTDEYSSWLTSIFLPYRPHTDGLSNMEQNLGLQPAAGSEIRVSQLRPNTPPSITAMSTLLKLSICGAIPAQPAQCWHCPDRSVMAKVSRWTLADRVEPATPDEIYFGKRPITHFRPAERNMIANGD